MAEPYRVFFPIGMVAGIWGVMMWPLVYEGMLGFYPGEAHPRVMVEGFMGAIILGFLGTAFPRLSGSRPWHGWEFCSLLGLWLAALLLHSTGRVGAGDMTFAVMALVLLGGMLTRWFIGNRDVPPPGFVLAVAGVAGAALAAACLSRNHGLWLGEERLKLMKLMLYQGFLLLPLLGIGPFLLPRLFGMPSRHSFEDAKTPPPGWWPRALASVVCGLLIIGSFLLEAYGQSGLGHGLRALTIIGWFASETPIFRKGNISSTPGNAVRWAIIGLFAGCAASVFWPEARMGTMHLFFAAGIALVTMAVATRVILGHAGRHDLLTGKLIWLRWSAGLLVLAAATRVTSDFIPAVRISHHIYAAWAWAIGGSIWLIALANLFLREGDDEKPKSNCPRRAATINPPADAA